MYYKVHVLVTVAFLVHGSRSFILTDHCLVPPPCTCDNDNVWCQGTNLSAIPQFTFADQASGSLTSLNVYFNNNDIYVVDQDAFINLVSTNATQIELYLSDNNIDTIDDDAFRGIEDDVTVLDLNNNNLTTIPEALGKLTSLTTLSLQRNPIQTLHTPVIFHLSRTVTSLAISLDLFSKWPPELHYFRFLSELYVDGYQLPRFPLNALAGLETTLTVLEISRSKLDRIPSAVCHLKSLRHLSYVSNPETLSPIFEPCNHEITSVNFLSIRDNNLKHFPDVFHSFTALSYLDVSQNNIYTIDSDLIPPNTPLTHLNMSLNAFHRVPSAVTHLQNVRSLYLTDNKLTSLEDFDLYNLTNLRVLQVSNNPLEYVSHNAFQSQQSFDAINFQNTSIDIIPRAVTSVTYIRRLDVEDVAIDCTCGMAYLNGWYQNTTTILGHCEGTGETIKDFFEQILPLCP